MKVRKTTKMSAKQVAKLKVSSKKKSMKCTTCNNDVEVDEDTIAVKCWECTAKLAPVPKKLLETKQKSDKPAGWRFMAEFIDKDGNVFHFGDEQPDLKGTKDPSNVERIRAEQKTKRKETKKKKEVRENLKAERLVKRHAKKQKALKKDEEKKQRALDKLNGKEPEKKSKKAKKTSKKKNTNSAVRYEKFEENRIATDRQQIQSLIENESAFAEHLRNRNINVESIQKIARTSYAAIDNQTGSVKNKRRGYKVSLETGDVKIININIK